MVAKMVGGEKCVPARDLSEVELHDIWYHKVFQFRTGGLSRPEIPKSGPQQQRALKNKAVKAAERELGTMQGLLLRHFRHIANVQRFFSAPKELFEDLPAQPLALAISSAWKSETHDPALPLQDRPNIMLEQPLPSPQPSLLASACSDQDEFITDCHPTLHFEALPVPDVFPWLNGEQVFFKVTHSTPNRMRRPTRSIDSLQADDVVIRLYRVCDVSDCNQFVSVKQDAFQDVWCTALLTSWDKRDGNAVKFINQFLEWQVVPQAQVKLRDLLWLFKLFLCFSFSGGTETVST